VVRLVESQLLPQPILALAQRADPAPDCGDMLANTEVDPLHERGIDVPAIRSQHGIDGLKCAKHDAVPHPHQATAAYGLDDLRVEQLWEWPPTGLGGRAGHLPARWLHPLPVVRQPDKARQAYQAARNVIEHMKAHVQHPELLASLEHSILFQEVYDLSMSN